MCGIIGYVGHNEVGPILLKGLEMVQYRGYDSVGIAILGNKVISIIKSVRTIEEFISSFNGRTPTGNLGLGHTRWATHGTVTETNAHPHQDCSGDIVVVHNGIVENFLELKEQLLTAGHNFASQTDTEVIAHLIESYVRKGIHFVEGVRLTAIQLKGTNVVVAFSKQMPRTLVGFKTGRSGGGLVIGYGDRETFLASDLAAIVPYTDKVSYLSAGELVIAKGGEDVYFRTFNGESLSKKVEKTSLNPMSVVRGQHPYFMLKEISEQPEVVMSALRRRVNFSSGQQVAFFPQEVPFSTQEIRELQRVLFVGMGTSYHAALIGAWMMESLARIPSHGEDAAEFRYRDPVVDSHTLVVAITQSGETADTLGAMEEAKRRGARLLTLCNVEGSQATQLAESTISLNAGPEICVLSTKTFMASLTCLYLLSLYVGGARGIISKENFREAIQGLAKLPDALEWLIAQTTSYEKLAERFAEREHFLYLGRGIMYPVALEGALKLKEASYIHAEGYGAAQMKHGPIALIDEKMPVLAIAPRDMFFKKMLGNVFEVKARKGNVIALGTVGDVQLAEKVDHFLEIPQCPYLLSPLLAVVPLQLIAYVITLKRGYDPDMPRNLAKSVTVE